MLDFSRFTSIKKRGVSPIFFFEGGYKVAYKNYRIHYKHYDSGIKPRLDIHKELKDMDENSVEIRLFRKHFGDMEHQGLIVEKPSYRSFTVVETFKDHGQYDSEKMKEKLASFSDELSEYYQKYEKEREKNYEQTRDQVIKHYEGHRYNKKYVNEYLIPAIDQIKNGDIKDINELNHDKYFGIHQVKASKSVVLKNVLEESFGREFYNDNDKRNKEILQEIALENYKKREKKMELEVDKMIEKDRNLSINEIQKEKEFIADYKQINNIEEGLEL